MPNIVQGNILAQQSQRAAVFGRRTFDYEYPDGLDLKPGSTLHQDIVTKVLQRATESHRIIQKRIPSWNEIDRVLTTYIDLSKGEKRVKQDDPRKPVSIIFPYSYVQMETLLTYLVMAFLQDPIFRYEGVSPEDTIGAIMMEKIIQVQAHRSKMALVLHTMFRDGLAYGIGAVAPFWKKTMGWKETVKEEPEYGNIPIIGEYTNKKKVRSRERTVLFEGNMIDNIDPYLYLPDPDRGIQMASDGEYRGWVSRDNYMDMLSEEEVGDGDLFNVKYLALLQSKQTGLFTSDNSERERKFGGGTINRGVVTNPTDTINMYIKIIPKEWKVGKEEYPRKWLFSVAADSVVVRAKPLELNHDMFPVATCAPDFDGYSPTPISRLEMMYGMQGVMDWMFNSHVANVRKAINDMLIVDPYMINVKDLKDPEPGGLIRLRRPAWGKSVRDSVHQLDVRDVTANNIGDISFLTGFMQKVGADESMGGSLRQGGPERLTKSEFQGTRAGGVSRMERMALVVGIQAMQDLGYMFASHSQQFMEEETYVKVAGRWQDDLMKEFGVDAKGRVKVSPFDILVEYDLIMRDGSVPSGNFSDVWVQMFGMLGQHPELAQRIDTFRVFKHIARNLGAKNVHEFERVTAQAQSNESVVDQADKGNIVPFEEAQSAGIA